ncbi:MAG: cupin domain-containing protein [Elusimicrobia bacterium]|nr:cupin domain-containing protein [Candidatus Liberimonas magnetica]
MTKKPIIKYQIKNHNRAWNPLFKDKKSWLFGFFKPKTRSIKDYDYLELHKYPELFILLEGRIVMTFKKIENSPIEKLELKKGEVVIFNCWHNGYALEKGSTALVIERPKNPTKHLNI